MDERSRVLDRLKELQARHRAATGEGAGAAEGFMQEEQVTRESYHVVARDAISAGILTEDELAAEGLGVLLDE